MDDYQKEQLENIRRVCESVQATDPMGQYADAFLHILNLVELIKANG